MGTEADAVLFDAVRGTLRPGIVLREVDANINDPAFADAAVETFLRLRADRDGAGEATETTEAAS
ncbi:MAG: Tm-1-like ATP-binding domain-containing protein [Chloroflexi bacterium]|jgi:uncharacterized protein (UPF0261 family)|nr:Tm-1-like ATP-binding domain-containing protein [Chloroflexota bacterium]